MLGERETKEIHKVEGSKGVPKLKQDAKAGGDITGNTRKVFEKKIRKSVVSKKRFLR